MENNFKTIKFELSNDGIGIISLNRPNKLNAISFEMEKELNDVLDFLDINLDCRVVILNAEGRGFCAGTDLQEGMVLNSKKNPPNYDKFYFLEAPEPLKKRIYHQWNISHMFAKFRKINQPIITLIQGVAAGGGFAFVMASDIRIASPEAEFINASINIGLTGADLGGSYFLPRLIGMSRAAEILLSGRTIDAFEAKRIGLVSQIVEKEQLIEKGTKLARLLLSKSPLGLRMTKQAINLTLDSPSLENIMQYENSLIVLSLTSKDVMEATKAFFGKKDPEYSLR